MPEKINILGVPVDRVNYEEALCIFDNLMDSPGCSLIVTPNSEIVVNASKDKELMKIISAAELVIPDGIGLVYASRILGKPLKERVTGIDFLGHILEHLEKSGKSVFFFGSKPGVAEAAIGNIVKKHPALRIAGHQHGYFNADEEERIVEAINGSGADFLCIALGSPKQEKFVYKYKDCLMARAAIGVGGSLDVWAGTVRRAPEFYRKNGLEWLFRFMQQPSRYKRMAALPLFMIKVVMTGGGSKK